MKEPADFVAKLRVLGAAISTINPAAVAVALVTIGLIVGVRRFRPSWPAILIAVATGSVLVFLLKLPVETIGTRFGGIPSSSPLPAFPPFSSDKMQAVLPDALSFALLGAIESLLSAMADGMTAHLAGELLPARRSRSPDRGLRRAL